MQSAGDDETAQPRPPARLDDTAAAPVDPGQTAGEGHDLDPDPSLSPTVSRDRDTPAAGIGDNGRPDHDHDADEPDPEARPVPDPDAHGTVTDTAPRPALQLDEPQPALQLDEPGPAFQLNELAEDQDSPKSPEDGAHIPEAGQDSSTGSPDGVPYTYHDGDAERRVWLVPGTQTVVPDSVGETGGDTGAEGQTGSQGDLAANSQSAGDALVFVSESGTEMTLPGGVALVLDPGWSGEEVDQFLAGNGISPSRVSDLGWIANGFLVATEPGLASLELANALATQEGVVISSPNWSSEATLN